MEYKSSDLFAEITDTECVMILDALLVEHERAVSANLPMEITRKKMELCWKFEEIVMARLQESKTKSLATDNRTADLA